MLSGTRSSPAASGGASGSGWANTSPHQVSTDPALIAGAPSGPRVREKGRPPTVTTRVAPPARSSIVPTKFHTRAKRRSCSAVYHDGDQYASGGSSHSATSAGPGVVTPPPPHRGPRGRWSGRR